MVPLCSAGQTANRGRKPPQLCRPDTIARRQGSDKSARAATPIFIHNGAPQALVGCQAAPFSGRFWLVGWFRGLASMRRGGGGSELQFDGESLGAESEGSEDVEALLSGRRDHGSQGAPTTLWIATLRSR